MRPWMAFDAASRARPSSVLGPVERPPWSLQRPLTLLPGRWHNVPRRVRASHFTPCQFWPYRCVIGLLFIIFTYQRSKCSYYRKACNCVQSRSYFARTSQYKDFSYSDKIVYYSACINGANNVNETSPFREPL